MYGGTITAEPRLCAATHLQGHGECCVFVATNAKSICTASFGACEGLAPVLPLLRTHNCAPPVN